jgi:Spy/CpxP family protein refolding chaperone
MKFPWKYILVSLVIGLLLGGSAGLFYSRDLARHWIQKGPEMFLRRLDHELQLTEPQRTQIRTLLNANRDKMTSYQDEIRQTARTQIRALLTSDQQVRFDIMIALHDAKRQKHGDH